MTSFKFFSALAIFMVAIIAGLWPFFKRKKESVCAHGGEEHLDSPAAQSMTSGIFLGAALLHLLPDSAREFSNAGYHYPLAFLTTSLSFLFFLFLEHISTAIAKSSKVLGNNILFILAIMLSLHSLLEGSVIGISANLSTIIIIAIAILAHKGAESFALSLKLNETHLSFIMRLVIFGIFAIMTPLGIFIGSWAINTTDIYVLLAPIFTALAAGTFLYIGTLHGLERSNLIKHCCNMKEFTFMLMGFALMAIVAIWT